MPEINRLQLGDIRTVKQNANNQITVFTSNGKVLFSYGSPVVAVLCGTVYLDRRYYNYSKTTIKHRNIFLGLTSKEVERKIKEGEFILVESLI